MTHASSYAVHAGWRVLLRDLGIRPADVLKRAGLPEDLFTREGATLGTAEYVRLWQGLEAESADPTLPIRIGKTISVEAFDPPIFAAMCSPNYSLAVRRISRYKKLIAPMALHVDESERATTIELEWLDATSDPPVSLVAAELVFFVQLARLATRAEIHPIKVTTTRPPSPADAYATYFGVDVHEAPTHALTFSAADAARPFLTADDKMWHPNSFFRAFHS